MNWARAEIGLTAASVTSTRRKILQAVISPMRFPESIVVPNGTINEQLNLPCVDGGHVGIGQLDRQSVIA
jgi:hypothetical protein